MSIELSNHISDPITLWIDDESFLYDVYGLVTSFFPGKKPVIVKKPGEAELIIKVPGGSERLERKNAIKRELYTALSRRQGHTLPWGTLTGVRPTKLTLRKLTGGTSFSDTVEHMESSYLVSKDKALLATTIAQKELRLMEDLPENGICLYIGIPFCPSICLYCSFSSYAIGAYKDSVAGYLDSLKREIKETAAVIGPRPVTAIYFGGGTPTSLTASQLEGLFSAIEESYDLSHLSEYTVEAGRPDSITEDKLDAMARFGISRISINPQTLQQPTLDTIGRCHTVEDFYRAYDMAGRYDFIVNTDLIVGLPGEGEDQIRDTLSRIKELAPENLTVHSLAKKRASRLTEKWDEYAKDAFVYTDAIEKIVYDTASSMSMEPYYMYRQKQIAGNMENVGFALPGTECLYNVLMMEECSDIASFGAGAVSKRLTDPRTPGWAKADRLKNPKDVHNYMERIEEIIQKKHKFFAP